MVEVRGRGLGPRRDDGVRAREPAQPDREPLRPDVPSDFRGRGLADEATRLFQRHLIFDLDFHRLQLECYGFNERAIRHSERSGFVREGVKRKAYRRHGEWVDGIFFGLIREDLD